MTQREIQNLLKVRVQVLLLEAVRLGTIRRERIEGFYLYLHNDPDNRDIQLKKRRERMISYFSSVDSVTIDDHIIIGVLLVLIRHPDYQSANIKRALQGHVPTISTEQVKAVFSRYNLEELGKKMALRFFKSISWSSPCCRMGCNGYHTHVKCTWETVPTSRFHR